MVKIWGEEEKAVLRELYPLVGGVQLCKNSLPERTIAAIHNQAKVLKLKTITDYSTRKRREFSEFEDNLIREEYAKNTSNAVLKVIALKLNINKEVVSRRASDLGLTMSRAKPLDWSKREIEILEKYAHRTPTAIQKQLKVYGFQRTVSAIANARKNFDLSGSLSDDEWTPCLLAKFFGVSPNTVERWIQKEELTFEFMPSQRKTKQGESRLIKRKVLKAWVATHAQCIDIRKVDRFWFIDLLSQ